MLVDIFNGIYCHLVEQKVQHFIHRPQSTPYVWTPFAWPLCLLLTHSKSELSSIHQRDREQKRREIECVLALEYIRLDFRRMHHTDNQTERRENTVSESGNKSKFTTKVNQCLVAKIATMKKYIFFYLFLYIFQWRPIENVYENENEKLLTVFFFISFVYFTFCLPVFHLKLNGNRSSNMLIADIIFIAANLSSWQSFETHFHAINIYRSFFNVSHEIHVVRRWVGEDRDVDEPCNSNPKSWFVFIVEIVVTIFSLIIIIVHLTLTYTRSTAYINDNLKINLSLSHVAHTLHRRRWRQHWERT